ncbi:hypothetical protein E2562_028671 [Oryza meyeriana var. granulata]|uniref:Uncharacterized protein n=1 Tax=Oryza meyeriana var. granulata TaxID=110450 RepID=A0A6G1BNR1_9ORYZ|nr:hypothetical protein E2562_028671 [Oryza meyeriana var. granulata]
MKIEKANAGFLTNFEMIEECGRRFSKDERGEACNEDERVEEFLELVKEVFPPPPPKPEEMTE